jgi:hypothetical protein
VVHIIRLPVTFERIIQSCSRLRQQGSYPEIRFTALPDKMRLEVTTIYGGETAMMKNWQAPDFRPFDPDLTSLGCEFPKLPY